MTVQNSMMVQNSGVLAPLLLVKSAEGTLGGGWMVGWWLGDAQSFFLSSAVVFLWSTLFS